MVFVLASYAPASTLSSVVAVYPLSPSSFVLTSSTLVALISLASTNALIIWLTRRLLVVLFISLSAPKRSPFFSSVLVFLSTSESSAAATSTSSSNNHPASLDLTYASAAAFTSSGVAVSKYFLAPAMRLDESKSIVTKLKAAATSLRVIPLAPSNLVYILSIIVCLAVGGFLGLSLSSLA